MTLVLNGKGLLLEGSNPKNRGQTGSRYIYIYISDIKAEIAGFVGTSWKND